MTAPGIFPGLLADWPDLPALQQPTWLDTDELTKVQDVLASYPPLVFAGECDLLRERMAAVSEGRAFALQGGDCAETLADVTGPNIRDRIKTILQMAVVLTYGAGMPIVKVGRMAGQFAKPRSSDTETRDGVTLPAYRGDMVNGFEFTPEARRHDPDRLLRIVREVERLERRWGDLQVDAPLWRSTEAVLDAPEGMAAVVSYTAAAPGSIVRDPADASNQEGGATDWCTPSAEDDCASVIAGATAIRIDVPELPPYSAMDLHFTASNRKVKRCGLLIY